MKGLLQFYYRSFEHRLEQSLLVCVDAFRCRMHLDREVRDAAS